MLSLAEKSGIYVEAGVTLDEIVYQGKLGGPDGVQKYLEARINQITGTLAQGDFTESEEQRVLLGIAAMREAVNLLNFLKVNRR